LIQNIRIVTQEDLEMSDEPFAKIRRKGFQRPYNREKLLARLDELLEQHNETRREAALAAGLDHQGLNRIFYKMRPGIMACILLANHWKVNPNELLTLAGWPELEVFKIETKSAENLPPEVVDVALDLAKIPEPGTRKKVAEAIRTLLAQYF
jgi:hypothetical protein